MENIPAETPGAMDRRQALKWIGAAAAAAAVFPHASAQDKLPRPAAAPGGQRIGWDPVLNKTYAPGELWPLTLTTKQRKAAASLTDLILPPDNPGDKQPSQLGVQDFIDEWISSPYDETAKDRPVITEGLDWLDAESQRRFQKDFADLAEPQKCAIADDICGKTAVKKEFKSAQNFFNRFRYLAASGYYTTPQGWKDVGYVGNVPMVDFPGPTPEALKHLGL
ncbi:MAG: gluconate 2-dehydrogenase subunit 3 family protein, partial [Opitutales bacterium]